MTKRKNLTKTQKNAEFDKRITTLETTSRFFQMLIQQLGNSLPNIGKDVKELGMQQRSLQYRLLALQEILSADVDLINKKAEALQVKDFDELSDKEDAEQGNVVAEEVSENSFVIFTSKIEGKDSNGVLRSKLLVSEIGFPDMKEKLLGKKVGETFSTDINGDVHNITVLGIRTPPAQEKDEQQPA